MSETRKSPKLAHTRPEKNAACDRACHAMREAMATCARDNELNHVEALNAIAQVFSSVLAGAYDDGKDREIVISALPDLVRAYLPQWDKIYRDFLASEAGRAAIAKAEGRHV